VIKCSALQRFGLVFFICLFIPFPRRNKPVGDQVLLHTKVWFGIFFICLFIPFPRRNKLVGDQVLSPTKVWFGIFLFVYSFLFPEEIHQLVIRCSTLRRYTVHVNILLNFSFRGFAFRPKKTAKSIILNKIVLNDNYSAHNMEVIDVIKIMYKQPKLKKFRSNNIDNF
jgi:hypothetical protein